MCSHHESGFSPRPKGVPGRQGWAESRPSFTRAWPGDEQGKCQFLSFPARGRSQTRPGWPWLLPQVHRCSIWPLVVGRAVFAWATRLPRPAARRGLTGTGAKPADPCRLRPLLPADPEAVVRSSAEHWPFLGAISTGYRALQTERTSQGPPPTLGLVCKGSPRG